GAAAQGDQIDRAEARMEAQGPRQARKAARRSEPLFGRTRKGDPARNREVGLRGRDRGARGRMAGKERRTGGRPGRSLVLPCDLPKPPERLERDKRAR